LCLLSDHQIVKHVTLEPPINCCITCYWCDIITYWSVFIIRWWYWQTCDLKLGPTNIEVVFIIKSLYCQTCDLRTTNKLLYYIWHHAYLSNHHNVKLDLIATNRLVIISYDTMFIYQIIIVKHVTLEPPISLCISYYSFDVINSHQTASVWHIAVSLFCQTCDLRLRPTNNFYISY
jgi:hypothetical protein